MYHGAILDRINTLHKWGLILMDDLEEGAPDIKTNYQDVGGMDGQLNFSYALTGRPVYGMRPVSFTLCRPWHFALLHNVPPQPMADVWAEFMARYHGREVLLTLPTDPVHHYTGVVQIGAVTGDARDRFSVSMTADPWRERNEPTRITAAVSKTAKTLYLPNETRPVIPTITATAQAKITLGGKDYYVDAGTGRNLDIMLAPGTNAVQVALTTASTGQITMEYTEAKL